MKRSITTLGLLATISGCGGAPVDSVPPKEVDPAPITAIAMRLGDLKLPPSPSDPDALFHKFEAVFPTFASADSLVLLFTNATNQAQACDAPVIAPPLQHVACANVPSSFQLIVIIPPELDRPGVIDLKDSRIVVYEAVFRPLCGTFTGGAKAGWWQDSVPSTLEIVSSDAESLSVKIDTGFHPLRWPVIEGDVVATRCGEAPPKSPPIPALAVEGASLSTLPDGTKPDADTVFLFFGTTPSHCEDPWASMNCNDTYRAALALPPALQKPGTISLADPSVTWFLQPMYCPDGFGPGAFSEGDVEIVSFDAGGVSFRVSGSFAPGIAPFCVDGLYAASFCP